MFRHKGKSRTLHHNLKLASLLSFVAGIVNVAGLLAVQKLTTNVTGHFAYFAEDMASTQYGRAAVLLLFILSFFLGAFCSNSLVEIIGRYSARLTNAVPVIIEICILTSIAVLRPAVIADHANLIACLLLFAMGLQNSLVTMLSNSIVRTTHLTGMITDLGIECSQLFFYRKPEQQHKIFSSIKLRLTIVCFFFLGGVLGGFGYSKYGIRILLAAALVLVIALMYDSVKMNLKLMKRKYIG